MADNSIIRQEQLNRYMEKGVLPIAEDVSTIKKSVVLSSNIALRIESHGHIYAVLKEE